MANVLLSTSPFNNNTKKQVSIFEKFSGETYYGSIGIVNYNGNMTVPHLPQTAVYGTLTIADFNAIPTTNNSNYYFYGASNLSERKILSVQRKLHGLNYEYTISGIGNISVTDIILPLKLNTSASQLETFLCADSIAPGVHTINGVLAIAGYLFIINDSLFDYDRNKYLLYPAFDKDYNAIIEDIKTNSDLTDISFVGNKIVIMDGATFSVDGITINNNSPYQPGGNSSQGGGGGSFGQGENSVDITPSIPTGSAEQALGKAGLYTRYLLNRTQLYTVGSILWSKNFLQGIEAALTKLFYASPAEMLIQLLSYPFNIEGLSPSLGTSQFVWGNYPFATDIGVVSVLNSPALQFDWGEVQLTEFWGSFLDYAPYTKIDLYLPFGVGFVPIDPNECVPGSIGVKTNFDMNTGAVIHTVTGKVTRNGATTTVIIGTYCGNAARQVPLISADISGKMLNVISTGVGLAVAGVQAGLATETPKINEWTYYDTHTGLSGTIYDGPGMDMSNAQLLGETFKSFAKQFPKTSGFKFATKSATALSAPTPVQRNGSFTSGVSGLGIQFPYIVVSRPDQSVPQQYGHHYGYPSNIYAQLSTLTGYTEVGSIHLENLKCTGEERNELDRLLKEGVFLGY